SSPSVWRSSSGVRVVAAPAAPPHKATCSPRCSDPSSLETAVSVNRPFRVKRAIPARGRFGFGPSRRRGPDGPAGRARSCALAGDDGREGGAAAMSSATKTAKHLTDEQMSQVLALAGESDSVELKLTVPDSHERSTVIALDMDPIDAQIRLV